MVPPGTFPASPLSNHQSPRSGSGITCAGERWLERSFTMRYLFSAVLAVVFLASAPAYPHERDRLPGSVSVEVVSESGATLFAIPYRDLWKGGTRVIKQYLEAQKGKNYGLVIRNMTPQRIGVVASVDGRN